MVNLEVPRSEAGSEIIALSILNRPDSPLPLSLESSPASAASPAPTTASPGSGPSAAATLSLRISSPSSPSSPTSSTSPSSSSSAASLAIESAELVETGIEESAENVPQHSPSKLKRRIIKNWKCFKRPSCQRILWWLLFFGFTIDQLVRININIVIIQMIEKNYLKTNLMTMINPKKPAHLPSTSSTINISTNLTRSTTFSVAQTILDYFLIEYNDENFHWNEPEQAQLFIAFFWFNWLSQIPGAILSKRYGPKKVFGYANLVASILCAFIPISIYLDNGQWLIYLRILQGFICGFSTGAVYMLIGRWIPIAERCAFLNVTHGSILAIILLYPLTGYLLTTTNTTWEWPYFLTALAGIIWFINWSYFIYNSPSDHPRIPIREVNVIDRRMGVPVPEPREMKAIPWWQILTCRNVWIIALSYVGNQWCSTTLVTQIPIYFRHIYKWPIDNIGYIILTTYLIKFISGHTISMVCDYSIKKRKHQKYYINKIRRFGGLLCCIVQGLFILILSALESTALYGPIILFTLAVISDSAVTAGPMASVIDMNPQYAGILMGLITMISLISAIGSPHIVGSYTENNQTIDQWTIVFVITGIIGIIFGIPYAVFPVTKRQNWSVSFSNVWLLNNRQEGNFGGIMSPPREREIDVRRQFGHLRVERRRSLPVELDRISSSIPETSRSAERFLNKNKSNERAAQRAAQTAGQTSGQTSGQRSGQELELSEIQQPEQTQEEIPDILETHF